MSKILVNAWKCPDGTILESRHRHDFVSYTDAEGRSYFVDGGTDYYRISGEGMEFVGCYDTDPHEKIREVFRWTTHGVRGNRPPREVALKDLSAAHIRAIIRTQKHLPVEIQELFKMELDFRFSIKIDFSDKYKYSEDSPTGLVKYSKSKDKFIPVGCIRYKNNKPESWVTTVNIKQFLVHRIIWEIINGEIPEGMVIDHIDGNPLNNNINNLRLTTHTVNLRNAKLYQTNTSGVCGVRFRKGKIPGTGHWVASWVQESGKTKQKCFSILKYPDAYERACEYRKLMISNLNDKGYDYSDRHGTKG